MTLHFCENQLSGNIMADLSRFSKISDYLQAVVNAHKHKSHDLKLLPSECGYDNKYIILNNKVTKDAEKYIRHLRKQVFRDTFRSENLIINANGIKKRCMFGWRT